MSTDVYKIFEYECLSQFLSHLGYQNIKIRTKTNVYHNIISTEKS